MIITSSFINVTSLKRLTLSLMTIVMAAMSVQAEEQFRMVYSEPEDGARNVGLELSAVIMEFSSDVVLNPLAPNYNKSNICLKADDGTVIGGLLYREGSNRLKMELKETLQPNTHYTFYIPALYVKDELTGKPNTEQITFGFYTVNTMETLTKMLSDGTLGKKWTWDYDGKSNVWGNMGYCGNKGEDVALNHYGEWWGVVGEEGNPAEKRDGFKDYASWNPGFKLQGDESMYAYMFLGGDGTITRYAGDGSIISTGTWSIELVTESNWKVANLHTTAGTILFPYLTSGDGQEPTLFEVVYLSDDKMCLVHPNSGDFSTLGDWSEATYWHFKLYDESTNVKSATTVFEPYCSDIYDIHGRRTRSQSGKLVGLRPGVYIFQGRKVVVK